ncbi:FecR domain-containing protein [Herbaspirillum sp. YR522]|uniref:FecR domain-containing protein n=1 Tax=Herbaspirillum sp. YR522 TaxID=1144342 RepID=UPI00026F64A5|nr:FecR domain-containing protein [Herbaspirillum sp. YR522]EJN10148.1 Fe2+-dicitrate sensor, membrane component [Herbaspirillum sp. YR522]
MRAPASTWYQPTADAANVPPQVAERALEWLVELQSEPLPPETIIEWNRWRAAHDDHERAWQRIESVRGRLQPLAASVSSAAAQAALAPSGSSHRRRLVKTLAVMIFAGGGAWGVASNTPWRQWNADYRTAIGERRSLALTDGSQIMLNTTSSLDVRYDANQRRLCLVAGELFVATARDAMMRPFLVETAHGTAQALGTRYTVRQLAQCTEVKVFEGAVRIVPREASQQELVVQAGHQARFSASDIGPADRLETTAPAWTDGFLIARSMRLHDFIAELSRYSRDSLACDPAVAQLRVSGSFPLDNPDQILETLAATLDVQIEIRDGLLGGRRMRVGPRTARRS